MGAFILFASFAAVFLGPLWGHLSTHIPGGLQDTRLFLWSAWWWREAFHAGISPYHTSLLFHPFGVSLLTHDMPLWTAIITTSLRSISWIAAGNIAFWLTWTLSGFCTYGLVREKVGSRSTAIVGGIYVMTSSYLSARAMQNWGQFNLFGIPLFLWALVRARNTGRGYWLAGVALAWLAACHLYFLIYGGLILLAVLVADFSPVKPVIRRIDRNSPASLVLRRTLLLLAGFAGAITLFILQKPGIWWIGPVKLSMQTPTNVLLVFYLSLAIYGLSFLQCRVEPRPVRVSFKPYLILIGTGFFCLLPLIIPSAKLAMGGDYPKQSILWKTHPKGVNVLAPFFPNPQHTLWRESLTRWYDDHGMNAQEQSATVGWVFLVVMFLAGAWNWRNRWLLLGSGATVLALGTHLHIAQWNTWMPLPFYVLRLLPIVGNVRIPERWMAVAMTAFAVVLAMALVKLSRERGWNLRALCAVVGVLILAENWPGIPALVVPVPDAAELRLKDLPSRGVLPVPLYIGDSSKGAGNSIPIAGFHFPIDDLLIQTTHRKPMVGGYIGRISRQLIMRYRANRLIDGLIRAEESEQPVAALDRGSACVEAKKLQIDHLLVTRDAVPAPAWKYLEDSLPLKPIEQGSMRDLYAVVCPGDIQIQ